MSCLRCASALERGDLRCPVCGLLVPSDTSRSGHQLAVTIVRCSGCHAAVSYDPSAQAPRCAFCGATVEVESTEDPIEEAEQVVPFSVAPAQAKQALRRWLGARGWFSPSDLRGAGVESLTPLHWAAWEIQAEAEVTWAADSNEGSRRSAWAPHSGQTGMSFGGMIVSASRGLADRETSWLIQAYDLTRAEAVQQRSTQSTAEAFELQRSAARALLLQALHSRAKQLLKQSNIPGQRFRKVRTSFVLRGFRARRLGLPAYVVAYRYRSRLYRCVVHGQDASVVTGTSPISIWKVLLAALTLLAGFLLLLMVFSGR